MVPTIRSRDSGISASLESPVRAGSGAALMTSSPTRRWGRARCEALQQPELACVDGRAPIGSKSNEDWDCFPVFRAAPPCGVEPLMAAPIGAARDFVPACSSTASAHVEAELCSTSMRYGGMPVLAVGDDASPAQQSSGEMSVGAPRADGSSERTTYLEMQQVNRTLLPVHFEDEVAFGAAALHPKTRGWLFEVFDRWLDSSGHRGGSRMLVLEGDMGIGKSTFLAALCSLRPDVIKAAVFCGGVLRSHRRGDARWVVRSLAAQLASSCAGFRHALLQSGITRGELEGLSAREMFQELVTAPLFAACGSQAEVHGSAGEKCVLVFDGIDECEEEDEEDDECRSDQLRHFIERHCADLPEHVVVVVAARPGKCWGQTVVELRPCLVRIADDPRHAEDVRRFAAEVVLEGLLASGADSDAAAEALNTWAQGSFLMVSLARPLLLRILPDRRRPRTVGGADAGAGCGEEIVLLIDPPGIVSFLPPSLPAALATYFGPLLRLPAGPDNLAPFPFTSRALLLAAVASAGRLPAARGAADLVENCPAAAVPMATASLAVIFQVLSGRLCPVHSTVLAWFADEGGRDGELALALQSAHAGLARRCLPMLQDICEAQSFCGAVPEVSASQQYAIAFGVSHLWCAGELLEREESLQIAALLFDTRYIRAKCRHAPDQYEFREWLEAAERIPCLARPLRLLRSALFVSTELVRQLPDVYVFEQVWDRVQKVLATRCTTSGCCNAVHSEPVATWAEDPAPERLLRSSLLHSHLAATGSESVVDTSLLEGLLTKLPSADGIEDFEADEEGLLFTSTLLPLLVALSSGLEALLSGHTHWVMTLAAYEADDGCPVLVSAGADETVRIWRNVKEGNGPWCTLEGHSDHVRALAAYRLADGRRRIASGSSDSTVCIWDPESKGDAIAVLASHADWVRALAAFTASDGSALLACGLADGSVKVWIVEGDEFVESHTLTGHDGMVMALASYATSSSGAPRVISGSADRSLRIWDAERGGMALRTLQGHRHWVTALESFPSSENQPLLASGCADASIFIWDPEVGGHPVRRLMGHKDWVCELVSFLGADRRRLLASASADRTVQIWDPALDGPSLLLLEGHAHWVRGLAVLPGGVGRNGDGRPLLASGSDDRTIRIWHMDV